MLIQYCRNKRRQKYGVVVAVESDGIVKIGWSLCNTRLDIFDKKEGVQLAIDRANNFHNIEFPLYNDFPLYDTNLPNTIHEMKIRAARYYKQAKVIYSP